LATDTWTKKKNMTTGRCLLSCCELNGKIYAIGGWLDGYRTFSTVEEYDPATDTWTRKSPLPTARWGLAASTVNGKIYAIGSGNSYPPSIKLRTVEEYDPVTDTWTTRSPMPKGRIGLAACSVDGMIYVPGGGGIEESDAYAELYVYNPGGVKVGIDDMFPVEFELAQNYPNPFNPSTTIKFKPDRAGMVNLVIYDLLGREVTTLVDDMKTPGSYEVTWNAQDHASGIYFYRIELGGSKVSTRKMLLLR